MHSQTDKAHAFRKLHTEPGTFVLPNPWDVGSAKVLAGLGFKALATTSSGMAWSMGLLDGQVTRDDVLAHCRLLADATGLPLAADLEDCFADTPEGVAETIRLGAQAGLVGGSIEDWCPPGRNGGEARMRPLEESVDRVTAAVEAARSLPFPFTLCARAENHIRGVTDLADTIKRLQAFQEAGADVLYAPGLKTLEDIRTVVQSVDRPVNILLGGATEQHTVAQMAELGVKRISIGGAFANAAFSAFLRAATEVAEAGTFTFRDQATGGGQVSKLIAGKA
jgi:2-methylisocitrate lyase-like PEP mutase family enzyme